MDERIFSEEYASDVSTSSESEIFIKEISKNTQAKDVIEETRKDIKTQLEDVSEEIKQDTEPHYITRKPKRDTIRAKIIK